jgi:hypothetical protein
MITPEYILMCRKAEVLQSLFINDEHSVNKDMLPAFIYDETNCGVRIIVYTDNQLILVELGKNYNKLKDVKLDSIIWLPTIEQMVVLYKKFCVYSNHMLEHSDLIILASINEYHGDLIMKSQNEDLIIYASKLNINQLYLLYIMDKMFDCLWDVINHQWISSNEKEDLN